MGHGGPERHFLRDSWTDYLPDPESPRSDPDDAP